MFMNRLAVVTNDLQYAAVNKHEARQEAVAAFLPRQIAFLQKARSLGIPVIHLQLIKKEDEANWHDKQFRRGEPGAAIIQEVLDEKDIIVEKAKDSGFFETKLDEVLKELQIDTVVICGMQTQICVQTTAADAYFRGYEVWIPSDAVVSTKELDTERALAWMAKYCAKVMSSTEILRLMESGHPAIAEDEAGEAGNEPRKNFI